jgi:subtilisin family serine protease
VLALAVALPVVVTGLALPGRAVTPSTGTAAAGLPITRVVAGQEAKGDPKDPIEAQLVVKLGVGATLGALNRRYGTTTESALLSSHGIYLLRAPGTPAQLRSRKDATRITGEIVKAMGHDTDVVFAEANLTADSAEDDRFHHWPSGGPSCIGTDPASYRGQVAVTDLALQQAHRLATGRHSIVAVLDSGVTATHPALAGRLAPGYDYVDDDRNPAEVADGRDQDGDGRVDEGYGHGTFVAGITALVAPDARILPMRVLDSEGRGNVFVITEAIFNAVDAGADVLNLSFGTADKIRSRLLDDALRHAAASGVVVAAAAGNDASQSEHYPAASSGVLAVAATTPDESRLADFSARGKWVDLAAPGVDVVSALPCGYGRWSGTSMATPFVSGAAALLGERWGTSQHSNRARRLVDGSDKLRGLGKESGVVDILRSLRR